jgi:hypothetical protein
MGHIARKKTEEHVKAVEHRIELLNKAIPSAGSPMRPTAYLLKHKVIGWNAMIGPDYFEEHGCFPTGDSAIATRNAYAAEWLKSKAPDDVREAFQTEYKAYVVSPPPGRVSSLTLIFCRRTSTSCVRPCSTSARWTTLTRVAGWRSRSARCMSSCICLSQASTNNLLACFEA